MLILAISDVQDLTAKLKLMEAGGETSAEPVVAADHHIYCNIHVGKEALLGTSLNISIAGNELHDNVLTKVIKRLSNFCYK